MGRFAVHKLGNFVEVVTRERGGDEMLSIDWDQLCSIEYLADAPVRAFTRPPTTFTGRSHGTEVTISSLRGKPWTRGEVRRLSRQITSISSPFAAGTDDFKADLSCPQQKSWLTDLPDTPELIDLAPWEVLPLQIRIGASCDYAQKTDGPIPYVVAAFVPVPQHTGSISVGGHKLAEGSHCWISPLIDLKGFGLGHLVADPCFTRTRGQERASQFRAVNRIREQLLMQLISNVARHGHRPGIISVDGSDPPTAQEPPNSA